MSNKKTENASPIDIKFLKKLSEWMHDADIQEVALEDDERSVRVVRRGEAVAPVSVPQTVAAAPTAVAVAPQQPEANTPNVGPDTGTASGHFERAPMVGVAYLASSPNDPPFVKVGQTVRVGDPLLIIEAMKVMNQIQATKAGVVKEILVENGQALEYDQPLVRID